MNNLLLPLLVICTASRVNAQSPQENYMAVPVISQNLIYLKNTSGGAGSIVSGQILQIDLPANTVEWYYTVTTKAGHAQFSNNDLTGQLVKLVDPEHGISKKNRVRVPVGTGVCNVYLMKNPAEAYKYVSNRPAAGFLMNDSREHIVSGTVPVRDFLDGPCYLVIKNSNPRSNVSVNIEVTAIVLSSAMESSTAMQ
jgi:hypothetical protein